MLSTVARIIPACDGNRKVRERRGVLYRIDVLHASMVCPRNGVLFYESGHEDGGVLNNANLFLSIIFLPV